MHRPSSSSQFRTEEFNQTCLIQGRIVLNTPELQINLGLMVGVLVLTSLGVDLATFSAIYPIISHFMQKSCHFMIFFNVSQGVTK